MLGTQTNPDPSRSSLTWRPRLQLKQVLPQSLRHTLRIKRRAIQYYSLRLASIISAPVLGSRRPLQGYHSQALQLTKNPHNHYIRLDPPEVIHYSSKTLDSSAILPVSVGEEVIHSPETFVMTIANGHVLYDYGVVVSEAHNLVAEVSPHLGGEPKDHQVLFQPRLPPRQYQAGSVAVISSTAHQRYFHWMFDVLPRLELLERSHLRADRYVVNTEKTFQQESLQHLGIEADRIISPTGNTHIEAEQLIVPSLPGKISFMTSRSCDFLRSRFLGSNQPAQPDRLLYITRNDALSRRVLNEPEVLELLSFYGFELLSLENKSIRDQVKLFATARVVVAPHGAGLTNLVFCSPHASVIEFMPDSYSNHCFRRLASLRNMHYGCLVGRTSTPGMRDKNHDHFVDIAELKAMVSQAIR